MTIDACMGDPRRSTCVMPAALNDRTEGRRASRKIKPWPVIRPALQNDE